jgi:hypothetical protein
MLTDELIEQIKDKNRAGLEAYRLEVIAREDIDKKEMGRLI